MAMAVVPLKASLHTACQTQSVGAPFNLHEDAIWPTVALVTNIATNSFANASGSCYSKCGLWTIITHISWELVRNAELSRPQLRHSRSTLY
jgi:hypothetical protein